MPTSCSVCLSTDTETVRDCIGYEIRECRSCSHVFVSDAIASDVLEKAYDESFYVNAAPEVPAKGYNDYLATIDRRLAGFHQWYREIERIVGAPGRCLDFGCAIGVMVRAAQDCGWNAVGYERSRWAAAYGREHFGIEIETGDGSADPFEAGSFDLITLWDVVEHLEKPREVIELVHRWLRPGGWIAINTLNSGGLGARLAGPRWRHLRPPVHLQYFTRRSLVRLLQPHRFTVRRKHGSGVFLAAGKSLRELGAVTAIVEKSALHWRFRPIADALNLLDEFEVLAQKPPGALPSRR
jgi:2-polyprenyl-3-methyl-5-hydroxy-6-metoxy-1,4-benzoquinol methylase